ncbi:vacuolar sorting receptor (Mrl1), putative [Talaromyces stipitatus ATCC 10500]|uniref:Vacuolar sorting receptor (Mrl1), putative n=1 Tax=Talaromyces stipitatus (strain ATCC 10500 / CBS 375.48 / QM 6759 / NRRL 1006) TaxID=441959 RepID=B8M5S7_TALSN|nr:vacuolar sorting receptor (Mrl1), putative [Talaromyces stipitatus ATCC 10500]EED20054.1 vacuolar sorting receptor (Mrl1), putative [Talaromyces stipitatus ATCC 10500]
MKMLTRPTLLATFNAILLLPLSQHVGAASEAPKKDTNPPCTVQSVTTGAFFDLGTISLSPPELKDGRKVHKNDRDASWEARGHDYGTNFTINICAPVIESVADVVGVEKARWQNVSAYYEQKGKVYSIGEQNSEPIFRGKRLVLNYTNGSPCPSTDASSLNSRFYTDYNDDDDDDDYAAAQNYNRKTVATNAASDSKSTRRKSTIMSFLCDREAPASQATVSFVGTMDSCTYFFEVRSFAACGGVAAAPEGGLGPAGVFGVIALIAVFVYLLGGCAYQRSVMHQRGWRQCPNYSMWSDLLGFFKDFVIIILSSLTRCFTRKGSSRAYSRVNGQNGLIGAVGGRRGSDRGGRGDVDAENRLIDQLDEEWND